MSRQIVTVMRDDLDGSPADEVIELRYEGVDYVIDLNKEHAAQFREWLTPWLEAAHERNRASKRSTAGRKRAGELAKKKAVKLPPGMTKNSSAARQYRNSIRQWGRDHGFKMPNTGTIPSHVQQAFYQAHQVSA